MLAEVRYYCGRAYLSVAGVTVAMEGDKCRHSDMPEEVCEPIPESELETATIGGEPVKDMLRNVVRFFRGDNWTVAGLEWAAEQINRAKGGV